MQNPKQSRNGKQRTKSKVCTEQEEWREEPGQQYQRSQWQGCVTYSTWCGCVKGNSSKSFPEPNPLSHQPHKACGKLPDNPGGDIVPSLDSKWKVQSAGRPGTPQVCGQPGPHVRKVQAWSSQTEKDPLHCEHMEHGGGGQYWRHKRHQKMNTSKQSERKKENLGEGAMTQGTLGQNDSENTYAHADLQSWYICVHMYTFTIVSWI